MVMNVVIPAITSVLTSVPFSRSLNNFSNMLLFSSLYSQQQDINYNLLYFPYFFSQSKYLARCYRQLIDPHLDKLLSQTKISRQITA